MSLQPFDNPSGSRTQWMWSLALALVALLCGILLGGLSAWFLASVAIAGLSASTALVFNIHIPGALVRLFAIGRTAARYGERLAGHKAALGDQVERRVGLFRAMAAASAVRGLGWQLGDQARLSDYLDDVEDLDFGRLRIDLPSAAIILGGIGLLIATAIVAPLALLPILILGIVAWLVANAILKGGMQALAEIRSERREGGSALGAAMAPSVSPRAETLFRGRIVAASFLFGKADRTMLAMRHRLAMFDAIAALGGPLAAIAVIFAAYVSGARSEALLVPVFVAFAWFAFAETLQGGSRILLAMLRREAARENIARWTGSAADETAASHPAVREIVVADMPRIGPDGRALGSSFSAKFLAGRPTVLTGASGSGKTSLLKQIAGWIGDDVVEIDGRMAAATERRAQSMLSLHDAAILADTVRANLFAPGMDDASLWAAIRAVELEDRIEKAGGLGGWITQEELSLGEAQRLNLARAFLTDRPIVLLDEPTEHLAPDQGSRILERLLARLDDRIVIASLHRQHAVADAARIDLDAT